jgi:hypothetical protein
MLSTPAQALSLYVDETALDNNTWPNLFDSAENMWITVDRGTFGLQAMTLQVPTEGDKLWGTFFDTIGCVK